MTFPILSSLVILPTLGALLLFFIRDDEANEPLIRKTALVVSLLVFAETLLLWSRFVPTSAEFQFVERYRLDSGVRHRLRRRRGRHQPDAGRAHGLSDAARAPQLVGIGPSEDARLLHGRPGARERDDRGLRLDRPVPVLRVLGCDAHPDVFSDRHLGLRPPHLRRREVPALYDGGQRADAAGDPGPGLHAQRGDRRLQLRPAAALSARDQPGSGSCGSSWRSPWRLPSRCRSFRSTPGCPTLTSRRRPPGRSFSRASC